MGALPATSRLAKAIGLEGVSFLENAIEALRQLLPHVTVATKHLVLKPGVRPIRWRDTAHTEIVVTLSIPGQGRCLEIIAQRASVRTTKTISVPKTLDPNEYEICRQFARILKETVSANPHRPGKSFALDALGRQISSTIVAEYLAVQHSDGTGMAGAAIAALQTLAEQTYENKSLSFGCLFDKTTGTSDAESIFHLLRRSKRLRALTDGFRTIYVLNRDGSLNRFKDVSDSSTAAGKHMFPEWARDIAHQASGDKWAIVLTRNGDILIFEKSDLRFSYRLGEWQYWNHAHVLSLLKSLLRGRKQAKQTVANVAGAIYRAALDTSFRRSGGLYVVLRNQERLGEIVSDRDQFLCKRRNRALEEDRVLDVLDRSLGKSPSLDFHGSKPT